MAIDFQLNAEPRADQGKGASRRLRRSGRVPAIIYGSKQEPQAISLEQHEFQRKLAHESFYSHILTINLGKEGQQAILKDVQRHPSEPVILHADFQRVSADEVIRVNVPLHFINETTAIGVKDEGGVVSRNMIDIEIECLPAILPEFIEVDLAELKINDSVHLSDIKMPEGVQVVALMAGKEHDLPVVAIHHARVTTEEDLAPDVGEEELSAEVPTVGEEAEAEAEGEAEDGDEKKGDEKKGDEKKGDEKKRDEKKRDEKKKRDQ